VATAVGDIIRAVLGYTYTGGGKPLSNVWHFKDTGGGGIEDADFINDFGLVAEAILVDAPPQEGPGFRYINIQLQNLTQDLIIATLVWPTFDIGGAATQSDASQVAALLRMITPKPGVQGRMFIPAMAEGSIGNSVFSASVLTMMANIGTALLAPQVIGTGEITYTVFNQVLLTDTFPTSVGFGSTTRSLTRRKLA